MTNWMGKDNF